MLKASGLNRSDMLSSPFVCTLMRSDEVCISSARVRRLGSHQLEIVLGIVEIGGR